MQFRRPFHISVPLVSILLICLQNGGCLFQPRQDSERKMYFAIASDSSGQTYSRAFNKTLSNLTQSYLSGGRRDFDMITFNISLETLVIELPSSGGFSSTFLEKLCVQFAGRHVAAVLVVGNSPAAFTVALVAGNAGIPVLWARGDNQYTSSLTDRNISPFEVHLQPTAREMLQALRALFVQTHWHTFTVLADDSATSNMLLRRELSSILHSPPLNPNILYLPLSVTPHSLFRRLADISRATRGVMILMSNLQVAKRVLEEAKRLNMVDGHFVWLWIDTGVTPITTDNTDNNNATSTTNFQPSNENIIVKNSNNKQANRKSKRSLISDDISDMHVNYLLKNDKFLLFNRADEFQEVRNNLFSINYKNKYGESLAKKVNKRGIKTVSSESVRASPNDGLPVGLLAIRALPLKVDRHLVKGAVRLLTSTLRTVLSKCPDWITKALFAEQMTSSCWREIGSAEKNFSTLFAQELKFATRDALAGKKILQENGVEKVDKSLVSNFEITNLVPEQSQREGVHSYFSGLDRSQDYKLKWRTVGHVTGTSVHLDTIVWPGGDVVVSGLSTRARNVFRVVTALAPPFVMEGELDEDGQCLRGLPCHRVLTSDKDNLTLVFNEMETQERLEEEEEEEGFSRDGFRHIHVDSKSNTENNDKFFPFQRYKYRTNCCYGFAMDLLENIAEELEFDFRLYIVADGLFGTRMFSKNRRRAHRDLSSLTKKHFKGNYKFQRESTIFYKRFDHSKIEPLDELDDADVEWNGIVGDLVSGAAHMSFAALSVSSLRSEVIDFSAPFFFSGVSFLTAPQQKSEIPLLAFLLPFSPELWIAIFTSLNITAVAVAVYEWLSPFGLNPWGRQRSKNFSLSSALWVMWGLLCGHLVAFKAPKSWPNKFLINVWGGFSVIFVASYTANIAALIAGLFFHNTVSNYHDRSLLSQRVGSPKASAAEYYVQKANRHLWDHMHRYTLDSVEEGVERLRNGTLDILIADTPILDYYRATDHGCKLEKIGDTINEDAYAVGMSKGFPLKDSISAVIAKYSSNGYLDILQEKWYGGLPCFKLVQDMAQPRPLGVAAVTGVFILLGVGMFMGCLILLVEHLFYRYTLPILRHKPKGTIWRSRNIMFFSQKLYRFINCVELVSPHHAARELVHTIRQGQITSLFQKSVKRKEHEQRRRRKSKAQFFEMIQEIRRVQQEEREHPLTAVTEQAENEESDESPEEKRSRLSPNIIRRTFNRSNPKIDTSPRSPSKKAFVKQIFSPRSKAKAKSVSTLNVRRFSTDSVFNSQTLRLDSSNAIGRRLSKDATFLNTSPPDINSRRSSNLDVAFGGPKFALKSPVLSIENVSDCSSLGVMSDFGRKLSDAESIGRKLATLPKYKDIRHKLSVDDSFTRRKSDISDNLSKSTESNIMLRSNSESKCGSNDVFRIDSADISATKSAQNLSDGNKSETEAEIIINISAGDQKSFVSDEDTITRKNKLTLNQLQTQLASELKNKINPPKVPAKRSNSNNAPNTSTITKNPKIRIEVEDTSSGASSSGTTTVVPKRLKQRHRSLGFGDASSGSRNKQPEHSQSLDSASGKPPLPARNKDELTVTKKKLAGRSRSTSPRCSEHDLPPAPPPPNCSPRNSNGKSPLERLSKEDLVLLWRSSESELRSHLLKALRDKDVDDPP